MVVRLEVEVEVEVEVVLWCCGGVEEEGDRCEL